MKGWRQFLYRDDRNIKHNIQTDRYTLCPTLYCSLYMGEYNLIHAEASVASVQLLWVFDSLLAKTLRAVNLSRWTNTFVDAHYYYYYCAKETHKYIQTHTMGGPIQTARCDYYIA